MGKEPIRLSKIPVQGFAASGIGRLGRGMRSIFVFLSSSLRLRLCILASDSVSSLPFLITPVVPPFVDGLLFWFTPPPIPTMDKPTENATPDLEASNTLDVKKESTVTQRWKQDLNPNHADLVCLLLCFLTGLCDSSAYNAWSCFLGMQTGMIHTTHPEPLH